MSDRQYNQFCLTIDKRVVFVFAKFSIGASGAPTLDQANSKQIKSVVRQSAGTYLITFRDTFVKFLGGSVSYITGSATTFPAAPNSFLSAPTFRQRANPTFTLVTSNAGVATDPASGETLHVQFVFGDSTAP